MSLERWKQDKQAKKEKKSAIKELVREGASHRLAKYLVKGAVKRIKGRTHDTISESSESHEI